MKSIATAIALVAAMAFATAAWAGPTYTDANFVGGYACGLSGNMVSGGVLEKAVGTGTIHPSGTGNFTASAMTVNVQGVGECDYKMDTSASAAVPPSYEIYSDGSGVAAGVFTLQDSNSGCRTDILV